MCTPREICLAAIAKYAGAKRRAVYGLCISQGCQMIFTNKKPENVCGDALCHKLTIYKQFSTYKFINTYSIKYTKKTKNETVGKARLLTPPISLEIQLFIWQQEI